jgi:hypothetical protein
MKITVCTIAINDWYQEIVKYAIENMEAYCKRHGYKFVIDRGNEAEGTVYDGVRAPTWYKLPLLKKNLPDCDYCVWIDIDAHILKPETKLEDFITRHMISADPSKPDKHMLFGKEGRSETVLNGGVVFVKNSEYSAKLLDLAWDNTGEGIDPNFHEQAALANLYTRNVEDMQNNVTVLPHWMQQEFLSYWYMYYPGECFIMHATRCSHDREGFIYTLDLFCPFKMREESDAQYADRQDWLTKRERCRGDIDKWLQGKYAPRVPSARNTPGWR